MSVATKQIRVIIDIDFDASRCEIAFHNTGNPGCMFDYIRVRKAVAQALEGADDWAAGAGEEGDPC